MFFTFNVQPKTNILICHAAIIPPERKINLCQVGDDPRLPHFVEYLKTNVFANLSGAIDEVEKHLSNLRKAESNLRKAERDLDEMIAKAQKGTK